MNHGLKERRRVGEVKSATRGIALQPMPSQIEEGLARRLGIDPTGLNGMNPEEVRWTAFPNGIQTNYPLQNQTKIPIAVWKSNGATQGSGIGLASLDFSQYERGKGQFVPRSVNGMLVFVRTK